MNKDWESHEEFILRMRKAFAEIDRLKAENALMREQLGVGKQKPLKWHIVRDWYDERPWNKDVLIKTNTGLYVIATENETTQDTDLQYIPLQDILDLIEEDE